VNKKISNKVKSALVVLRDHKADGFVITVIGTFVLVFAILEITLISALEGRTAWNFFFETGGVGLSMLGGLWTALGVRMSPREHDALVSLKNTPSLAFEELVNSLQAASRFATFGAYCILVGGVFLCIKIWFF